MTVDTANLANNDTREKLLNAAHRQFAERGFHGASIALIAGEVGLTKQALLYHFKRKDDLYREVLKRISQRLFDAVKHDHGSAINAAERFEDVILSVYRLAVANPLDTKVLMHELLEDQRRDAPQEEWFFKSWLKEIIVLLDEARGERAIPFADKVAQVYMLVSAIQFFAASGSVLNRFYGGEEFQKISEFYPRELRDLIRRMVAGS